MRLTYDFDGNGMSEYARFTWFLLGYILHITLKYIMTYCSAFMTHFDSNMVAL